MHRIKTAISLPQEDFQLVETLRKQTHKSRSQILLEAFHAWLEGHRQEALETRYEEAYRKHPEKLGDIEALVKAGTPAWGKERW